MKNYFSSLFDKRSVIAKAILSNFTNSNQSDNDLEKGGKRAGVGEVRKFGENEYIRTPTGWKYRKSSDEKLDNSSSSKEKTLKKFKAELKLAYRTDKDMDGDHVQAVIEKYMNIDDDTFSEDFEQIMEEVEEEESVKIPNKEFVDEHKRLIDVLKTPSKEDDKEELKRQEDELRKLRKVVKKTK